MVANPARNSVRRTAEGLVEIVYRGDQTAGSVAETLDRAEDALAVPGPGRRRGRLLTDLGDLGRTDSGARRVGVQRIRTLRFDRAAIVAEGFTRHLANLIFIASGRSAHFRFFRTRAAALEWLGGSGA